MQTIEWKSTSPVKLEISTQDAMRGAPKVLKSLTTKATLTRYHEVLSEIWDIYQRIILVRSEGPFSLLVDIREYLVCRC